ncbi:hypothetical protein F0P96_09665 [Hymenobacter busanensis]|uniref:Uncharacterized protein n=1 Tax=Hymenobacter busanensis TaxID=2607656 RepID=A0A7L4ZXX2_9BACT|nr:hypothetical protein [Hymenobacter busanensis]KAA9333235.1 hypothetical protein F0P96_09665 [Hymenobacter busanensis]QHJ08088.1 hypothetical protein GUY19_12655 [Hymenobacter busanensis]
MKMTFKTLLAVAAFGLFATTSCSEKTQENAEATTESAANDAAANTEAAGDAVENATDNAAADVNAATAPEKGDTAVVRNQPADGVVDKTAETDKK